MTAPRDCSLCGAAIRGGYCCGIDYTTPRRPWRMTTQLVRLVHIVARSQKGLDEATYRDRLRAVGVSSSLALTRDKFHTFLAGLGKLPDCEAWKTKQQERKHGRGSAVAKRDARHDAAGARRASNDHDDGRAVPVGRSGAGDAGGSAGLVGMASARGSA
jgi:hypothetical protein